MSIEQLYSYGFTVCANRAHDLTPDPGLTYREYKMKMIKSSLEQTF